MADAIVHWHQYRIGGGHWSVQVLNMQMRDGTPLYIHPPKTEPASSLRDYVLVLVKALEKRALDGDVDEALADHIERLLGMEWPDPAGEAEYESWFAESSGGVDGNG